MVHPLPHLFNLVIDWINEMLTVYGIPNCDTVKKARTWLNEQGVTYVFHDYKKLGVPADHLDVWIKSVGWEALINRKGTTWRQLDEAVKLSVVDSPSAKALMLTHASVIKRPIFERKGRILGVGFNTSLASILTP